MSTAKKIWKCLAMSTLVVVGLGACSFSLGGESPADAAVDLIEGDFADTFSLPVSNTTCVEPASDAVGTTFTCTADHDGAPVNFDVLIDAEDHINVNSTNVVYPSMLEAVEATVIDSMNDQGDFGLTVDAMDCGDQPLVLDADMIFTCGLTEPGTTNVFDTTIRMNEIESLTFDFEVAAEPR